jgi:hypothetical protein
MRQNIENDLTIAEWLGVKTELMTAENCSPIVCGELGITPENPVLTYKTGNGTYSYFRPSIDWNHAMSCVEKIAKDHKMSLDAVILQLAFFLKSNNIYNLADLNKALLIHIKKEKNATH